MDVTKSDCDPLLGETRTLTNTIQLQSESTCPTDFMDTGDQDLLGTQDEKPQADTVASIMDPTTAPLTDDEPLNWTIWNGDDLLMTPTFEVSFDISSHISKLNCIPCRARQRRMSLQTKGTKIRLNRL